MNSKEDYRIITRLVDSLVEMTDKLEITCEDLGSSPQCMVVWTNDEIAQLKNFYRTRMLNNEKLRKST